MVKFQELQGALPLALAVLAAMAPGPAKADLKSSLEHVIDATLVVHSPDATDTFLGSAFLWGGGHIAVTCAHVVYGESSVLVTFADGHEETAHVLARDQVRDVAVLEVSGGEGHGLTPAKAPAVLGQTVYAVGAPLGVVFTVTRGMASARPRQFNPSVPIRLVQHDASVNNGNSGGPLVDRDGHVVGMNSEIVNGSPNFIGLSFAISAADLERIVPRLIAGTLAPVPKLGLRLRPVDGEIASALAVPQQGELIDDVKPNGIAARGGLRPGDILTDLNKTPIKVPGDIAFLLEANTGQHLAVGILRGHERMTLDFDLGPKVTDAPETEPVKPSSFPVASLGLTLSPDGVVTGLEDRSAAKQAGLKLGDTVLAADGHEWHNQAAVARFAGLTVHRPLLLMVRDPQGNTRHVIVDPWHPWFDPQIAMGIGAGPDVISY